MTDLELKQMCANMEPQPLMNLLKTVEAANNKVIPVAQDYVRLLGQKKTSEEALASSKKEQRIELIVAIALGVIGAVFLITSGQVDKFSGFFRKIFGVAGIVGMILTIVAKMYAKKTEKKEAAALKELEVQIPQAEARLEQLKTEHAIDMKIRQVIFPQECLDPKYMRTFVSYFENGRASSLKEAYALFDELLHRERMEGYAQDQVQAARAAEYAAQNAANAANQAAANANQAKSSADWAAYWTRFKD